LITSEAEDVLRIYTDGGCKGNPGPGGWAAIIIAPNYEPYKMSGGEALTTNNRMELTAVINALEKAAERFPREKSIELITDSQYVQKGVTEWLGGWIRRNWKRAKGKPVKNQDLWVKLEKAKRGLKIDWKWVKGHAGNTWNERCHELAKEGFSGFS